MAAKPKARTEFVLFDVVYDDGSQRSNRRVPADLLSGLDGDEPARAFLEGLDRDIAERAQIHPAKITSVKRSGKSR